MNGDRVPLSTTTSLGELIEEFRPGAARLVAGVVVGVMMIGGGLALGNLSVNVITERSGQLPMYVEKGASWSSVGLGFLVAACLVVAAGFLFWYVRMLHRQRIDLYTGGFRYRSGDSFEDVAWGVIERVRETVTYERPPVLKGAAKRLIPKHVGFRYDVYTTVKCYHFDADSVKEIKRLGDRLRDQARAQGVPWETLEEHR